MGTPTDAQSFLGRYRLDEPISRGAFGEVWRAFDEMLDRPVAVKLFKNAAIPKDITLSLFLREIRAASHLQHPNIIEIYDFFLDPDQHPAIVMQYIHDGLTLNDIIAEDSLSPKDVARMGIAAASALGAAHRAGIIHGDIKPSNVLIGSTGHITVSDFGLSRFVDRFHELPKDKGVIQGTPLFMAPEVVLGLTPSPASDIWALGVTLYLALENSFPFSGEIAELFPSILEGRIRPFVRRSPLSKVIFRMLEREPADRPSAPELEALLRDIVGDQTGQPWQATVRTRGFGDSPAGEDLLGRSALVEVITDLLSPTDEATSEGSYHGGPQVITIDGPWGAGKTTIMRLVQSRLEALSHDWKIKQFSTATVGQRILTTKRRSRITVIEAYRILSPRQRRLSAHDKLSPYQTQGSELRHRPPATALFEPWAHQSSEQVWAGLAKTINQAVVSNVFPDENAQRRFWFRQNAERLDRSRLRRHLRQAVMSPLLKLSAISLAIPATLQLLKMDTGRAPSEILTKLAWAIPVTLIGLGIFHTLIRFTVGRADASLPEELFKGPVLSGTFKAPNSEPVIRDPLYNAQSGSLYLFQHDVKAVLDAFCDLGGELVIFVDDLDRCDPPGSVEVLQALNLFLSGTLKGCRLVIGLDQTIVAAQLDQVYGHVAQSAAVRYGHDPSAGWTFLRKLTHLPVTLPRVRSNQIDLYLTDLLGPVITIEGFDETSATKPREGKAADTEGIKRERPQPAAPAVAKSESTTVYALEAHPDVRAFLRSRIHDSGELSGREAKRFLTLWQFYLRLLLRATPDMPISSGIEVAKTLATFVEIFTRWPAIVRALSVDAEGSPGLVTLIDSIHDDIKWNITLNKLQLKGPAYQACVKELRKILLQQDRMQIRRLATILL
ncbi:protein kinase [Micromonospora zamorensis]|uniref:protein kinase domain-containing protein n=1 Tax=Micromonospora zamorensis TaxID=709883 RepID=UPI00352AB758|nr:protein kinase [Micromonospora zamorensis]